MTIRNLDDGLKQRLRVQAARHGRSMEEEVRDILRSSLSADTRDTPSLVASIRSRIEPLDGIELEPPARDPIRTPPELGT
jgi:plasmid stability protein